MQRLAAQAMRFTDAHAVPLCSPTRASILTGQYSARHGVTSASGHRPAASPDASPYPEKAAPGRRFLYADSKKMVRWPGRIEPGSTSDAVVGAIDLYPTILQALGLTRPRGHIVDGVSLLPVLKQTGTLDREAYFTWFPHLIPAVSVRQGDWKLIRRFEPHPDYPAVRELYHLKDDIGETGNLAKKMPDKVVELDALIDAFMKDTGALAPIPNPAYVKSGTSTPLINRRRVGRFPLLPVCEDRDTRRRSCCCSPTRA
jgi:arylsulfatase A-like enzyme